MNTNLIIITVLLSILLIATIYVLYKSYKNAVKYPHDYIDHSEEIYGKGK